MKEIKIIKRDGIKDDFNVDKIENAIRCAYEEYEGTAHTFYNHWNNGMKQAILNSIEDTGLKSIDIEQIQDIVVGVLGMWEKDVAHAYQDYRESRTIEREKRSNLDKEIDGIVKGTSEENTANGNVDGSKIQSIRALVANVACRDHARRHSIPKKFRKKHKKELYIHDEHYFDLPFFNCCVADWPDMFKGGFDLGTTHIETPKSLETAVNVLTQVASHISSNTYGGTTFDKLVTELTPYAKKSLNKYRDIGKLFVMPEKQEEHAWYMLNREIEHSMQSLEYEIQTLMTSRGETPFLTLGIDVIDDKRDDEEKRIQQLITEAILHQRLGGLTGGVTPVFPKLVYQLDDGNNLMPTDPHYELFKLAVKTSALRGYPDYTMTGKVVEITGSYKAPMGKLFAA